MRASTFPWCGVPVAARSITGSAARGVWAGSCDAPSKPPASALPRKLRRSIEIFSFFISRHAGGASKRRDGVEGRTRPARNRERRGGQQKIPALPLAGGLAQGFQVAIVEDGHAQRNQHQLMNGLADAFHSRRHHVARRVGADHRYVALLYPARAGSVESGRFLGYIPRPLLRAARPAAGAKEHHVSAPHLDASLLLPRLQVFGINGLTGIEVGNPFETRDV